jgi:hypothetical protein
MVAAKRAARPAGSQAVFWLKAGSVKAALSRPAHQRVTRAVSHLSLINMGVLTLYIQAIILPRDENPIHSSRCCL